jgi:FkbM family methyltransferase
MRLCAAFITGRFSKKERTIDGVWTIFIGERKFRFHTRGLIEDFVLLRDVAGRQSYRIPPTLKNVRTIVDLGANIGASSMYLQSLVPSARIIAVEANPALMPALSKNIGQCHGSVILHAAVTGIGGVADFFVDEQSVASSLVDRNRGATSFRVPAMTLADVCALAGCSVIDVLKIDIEGAEWEVLSSPWIRDNVRYIVGEFHEDLTDHTVDEFVALMSKGFDIDIQPTPKIGRYTFSAQNKETFDI